MSPDLPDREDDANEAVLCVWAEVLKMRNLLGLSFLLAGCSANQTTIWVIDVAPTNNATGDSSCSESFNDGDCPADATDPASEWTTERTSSGSHTVFFAELIQGPGKEGWLVVQGTIVPGTRKGSTWTFTWSIFSEEETVDRHESGYFYREYTRDSTTTTMVMTEDGPHSSGTLHVVQESTEEFGESDEWDYFETGVYSGQIEPYYYLDGDAENYSEEVDCSGDCEISVTQTTDIDTTFTSTQTHADEETFDAIQDAGSAD
jgi:hypothetical protein